MVMVMRSWSLNLMVCSDGRLNECMTWEMKVIDNRRTAFYLKLTSLSIIVNRFRYLFLRSTMVLLVVCCQKAKAKVIELLSPELRPQARTS